MEKFTGVVVKIFDTGVVLVPKNAEEPGNGYFLHVSELIGKDEALRQKAKDSLSINDELRVAVINPDPVQSCADNVWRPLVSAWQIEAARRAQARSTVVDTVKAWHKKGGGTATIVEVQAKRGYCLLTPDGETFTGLLHVSDMVGGAPNAAANNTRLSKDLKPGDKIQVTLKEMPRIKKFRPAIRLMETTG